MTRVHALLPLLVVFTACGGSDDSGLDSGSTTFNWPENTGEAVSNYASIVEATYSDSVSTASALDTALETLVATPSESNLTAARTAWLDARVPYLQTEVFRFYDGPIDNAEDGPEGLLNAWPLDENYIDYVVGDENAGVINGTDTIDAAALEGLNEVGGEKNIATGYHAIEFLLWGQDLSDTGPGERPYTDYVTDEGGTASNQDRRGTYLMVSGDLLVSHLTQVHDAWKADAAYRTDFEAAPNASFGKILTGMIVLSGFETGGERLQAALDSGDREDEHSCFSDNTKVDMVEDVQGVKNVWEGTYGSVSGTGIKEVVAAVDAELAASITAQIDTSLAAANALQDPFEQEIDPANAAGNARVQALIDSLRAQEGLLEDVFVLFELSIPHPE